MSKELVVFAFMLTTVPRQQLLHYRSSSFPPRAVLSAITAVHWKERTLISKWHVDSEATSIDAEHPHGIYKRQKGIPWSFNVLEAFLRIKPGFAFIGLVMLEVLLNTTLI